MRRNAAFTVVFVLLLIGSTIGWAQDDGAVEEVDEASQPAEPVTKPTVDPQPEVSPAKPVAKPATSPPAKPTAQPAPQPVAPPRVAASTPRVLASGPRLSVEATGPQIPVQLQPWIAWALHETPNITCPDVRGARICRWPGTLRMSAERDGATFSFDVYADREVEFALPGNKEHWPQSVQIDGAAPPVLSHGDVPHVLVPAGQHRLTGAFFWDAVPEVVAVPPDIGNVELTLAGRAVERPRVDAAGRLWLRDGNSEDVAETETDSVRASIYRRITDGVPLTVTTRLRLNVSGRAREVELGKILVAGSRPTAVRAEIPLQVRADGETTAYVRPGSHDLEIDAVVQKRTQSIIAPQPTPNFYDPQEVWVWEPNEQVRSVELRGLTAVDPERTSLPEDWGGFTTYLAEPGKGLELEVTRRGVVETQPNALTLVRELWLDLDGEGYTVRDRVSGTLHQDWRLDYSTAGDARLGRVAQGGENLLITNEPATGLSGVELRDPNLNLEAEVRVERARSNLAIVGWDHDVQSLSASLHLPPGWRLLGGQGVDEMRGTWIESWTLWDLLFVLLISIVVGRLFGWQWAVATFFATGLAHGEADAPRWVWIHLITSLALLRVLPEGWWRKGVVVYRWGALTALIIIMAPFVHDQVLTAFNPQVGNSQAQPIEQSSFGGFDKRMQVAAPAAEQDEYMEAEEAAYDGDIVEMKALSSLSAKGGRGWAQQKIAKKVNLQQLDPNAVVQTGPGLPNWSWRTWNLRWTGPVGRDHKVSLWLLSPTMNTVLSLMRVILLIFLGLLLIAPRDMFWNLRKPAPAWWRTLFGTGAVALFAAFLVSGVAPRDASAADVPDAATLQQIRDRYAEASQCPDPCVVASDASIALNGLEFEMSADVSAAKDTAWTLPGPADALRIRSVKVDGATTNQLRRVDDLVQVRLAAGNHTVVVAGTLVDRTTVTVQFDESTRPRHLSFDATDWAVDGISPTGVPDNSLQLTRTESRKPNPDDRASKPEQTELPPWYTVERRVALGMPWQIQTTVRRDDGSRPQLVKLPLVASEKVISEGVRVEDGNALVDFARGQTEAVYVSEIEITDKVALQAPLDQPWTETWIVECSRIWRCAFSELPPVSIVSGTAWEPRWRPWPGESLTITVGKPQGAEGQPKTVENVRYSVTPGKRLMQAELTFNIRASQGGWQEVTLPSGAKLQSVSIRGEQRSIRPVEDVVRLPIQPGLTDYRLTWQQPWERGTTERVPEVDIGSEAANLETTINLGGDRWLLVVLDDKMPWGPAVLFWWSLLMTGLLAMLLGALPDVPLKWWEWGLIAVGMSQLPAAAMLPIVAWFLVLSWRGRAPQREWYRFDLLQLAVLFLTLVAIVTLYAAAHSNLVLNVDMQVEGYGSSNSQLIWYADRVNGVLPTPAIVSLPILVFRGISFLWALWIVVMIVRWARWGWTAFSTGGWWKFPERRPERPKRTGATPPPPPPVAEPPSPVPRNARDGELVHVEHQLGRSRVTAEDVVETVEESEVTEALEDGELLEVSEPAAEVAPPELKDERKLLEDGEPAADVAPPELKDEGELGDLTTDDVIGALMDDASSGEEE